MDITELYVRGILDKADSKTINQQIENVIAKLQAPYKVRAKRGLSGKEASDLLTEYSKSIENYLKDLLTSENTTYWLHLARRLPLNSLPSESTWSANLAYMTLNLAIAKYGNRKKSERFSYDRSQMYIKDLTEENVIDFIIVQALCAEHKNIDSAYRRVNKGASLKISDKVFDTPAPAEVEKLMKSYDDRIERYGTLLSMSGAYTPFDLKATKNPYNFLYFQPNFEEVSIPDDILGTLNIHEPKTPNFYPSVSDIKKILELYEIFDNELMETLGINSKEIVSFLLANTEIISIGLILIPQLAVQFLKRAYKLTSDEKLDEVLDELGEHIAKIYIRLFDQKISEPDANDIAKRLFRYFSYTNTDLEKIDLNSKSPIKFILTSEDAVVIDLSMVHYATSGIFTMIGEMTDNTGNAKGDKFNKDVIHLAGKAGLELWECQKELKTIDGKKREIDASFIIDDTLYILECKAYATNQRVARGEYNALKTRWENLSEYLNDVKTLKDFLKANRKGTNYAIREGVKKIEYFVLTPRPEYIPSYNREFWFNDRIPRITVLNELLDNLSKG